MRAWRRREDAFLVERMITAAAKGEKAVTGVVPTVEACLQGRVRQALYGDDEYGNEDERRQCVEHIASAAEAAGKPPPVEDNAEILDWVVARVLGAGGSIRRVRDPGSVCHLGEAAGGIGAFLR